MISAGTQALVFHPYPWSPESLSDPTLPSLGRRHVHVWALHLPDWSSSFSPFWNVLSSEERARADRFRFPCDRHRSIVGRGMLRLLSAHYLARSPNTLSVQYGPYGKPYIASAPGPFDITLSHSGNWLLIAAGLLSNLGVDIEQHQTDVPPLHLAESVFSPWERRQLRAMPSALHASLFFDLWSRKEAVIKADGAGVSFGLHRFDVEFRPHHSPAVRHIEGEEAHRWTLRDLKIAPNYSAAIAARHSPLEIHAHALRPTRTSLLDTAGATPHSFE